MLSTSRDISVCTEISCVTGLSNFSMGTPYSGSPVVLPGARSHVWHVRCRCLKQISLPALEAGASTLLNFGWELMVMCLITFWYLRQLLLGLGVIPHWPLNNILSLWMPQLWERLKVLIAKLQHVESLSVLYWWIQFLSIAFSSLIPSWQNMTCFDTIAQITFHGK